MIWVMLRLTTRLECLQFRNGDSIEWNSQPVTSPWFEAINIMLERVYNNYRFSGLIDFGLSLRKNTVQMKQVQQGALSFCTSRYPILGQLWLWTRLVQFHMITLHYKRSSDSVESELTSERNLAMFLDNSQISDPNVQTYLDSLQKVIDLAVDCRVPDTTTDIFEAGVNLYQTP